MILAALLSTGVWYQFAYPSFSFIDLSVDRREAVRSARHYLQEKDVTVDEYHTSAIFKSGDSTDHYLQKALGFKEEKAFLRRHDISLFYWAVRFFQENEKEEHRVTINAANGRVEGYTHVIKETDARETVDEETARQKAAGFLSSAFGFRMEDYEIYTSSSDTFDHRIEHTFIWKRRDVDIPWSSESEQEGGAKLLTRVKVSGDEILSFSRSYLQIPESFRRYIAKEKIVGGNLTFLFRIIFLALLTFSVFFIILRRNNLALHTIKRFALSITFFIFFLYLLDYFNNFQTLLYSYQTTDNLWGHLGRGLVSYMISTFIVVLGILMPYLAGESLRYEVFPDRKKSGLLHYVLSSFLQKNVCFQILAGYGSAAVLIGIQSGAFEIGHRYLNVWSQQIWMPQISNSYLPFLAAFILGSIAGIAEEFTFRLFSISLGKKFFRSTLAAVIASSVVWGIGHSGYEVYPMWFRGLEVTCLGFFLAYVFLRFGLIAAIVAHYLFDVFWGASPYLLGESGPYPFLSSLAVLLLPLAWAAAAYIRNRPAEERPLRWLLNKHQQFNLEVLKNYLQKEDTLRQKPEAELKKELTGHGWDLAVVEIAIEDIENRH